MSLWNRLPPTPDNIPDYLNRILGRPPYATEPPRPKSIQINEDTNGYYLHEIDTDGKRPAPATMETITAIPERTEDETFLEKFIVLFNEVNKIIQKDRAENPGAEIEIGIA